MIRIKKAIISLYKNRKVLQKLNKDAGIDIEIDKLKSLCSIAEVFGSGKSSGAGGGDCRIAFLKDYTQKKELYKRWIKNSICREQIENFKVIKKVYHFYLILNIITI